MWLIILAQLAAQPCTPKPVPCTPARQPCIPNLVVEIVDPLRLPLPGATVKAKARSNKEVGKVTASGGDGLARFCVAGGAEYEIRVDLPGFKKMRVRSQVVPTPNESTVALRMRVEMVFDGRMETVE